MPNVAAFLSYVILSCYTPGPNNIMAMTNAAKNGFRKGMRFCFGMLLGSFTLMCICAAFTAALFRYIPVIEPYMKYGGAAYILWLAWVIIRDKPHEQKKRSLEINSIFTGFFMQFINPKAILYGVSTFSTFIMPYYKELLVISGFVIFLTILGFLGVCSWAVFGSVFQRFFEEHKKGMNLVMGILLIYCAYSLIR